MNNYLADQYFHQGNFDQAVNAFDRVTIINPVGIEPYSTAAWLLWSSGKNDQALDFYQRMIAANPNNPDGYFELGLFYVRLHNDTEAVKWLGRAVQLGLRAPKNHLYGLALTRLGRNEEALAFWRQVLADSPNDEIAQREIGRLTNKDKDKPPTQPAAPQQTPNKK
ncbi:MAG TPA: tetratricopeptide repeat protein [Armatimonadota bacterium]|nr:tetratricopeptide repeat protein [Armatimonadota bacterium]